MVTAKRTPAKKAASTTRARSPAVKRPGSEAVIVAPPDQKSLMTLARDLRSWTDFVLGIANTAADLSFRVASSRLTKPSHKAAVEKAGGRAVMTRGDHPSGSDRIFEALEAVDPEHRIGIVVNVQGDLPTIEVESVRACVDTLASSEADLATLGVEIADEHDPVEPAPVEQGGQVVGAGVQRGRVVAERRAAEAALVRRQQSAGGRQRLALRQPHRAGQREGVQQNDRLPGPHLAAGQLDDRHSAGPARSGHAGGSAGRSYVVGSGARPGATRATTASSSSSARPTNRCLAPGKATTSACGTTAKRSRACSGRR